MRRKAPAPPVFQHYAWYGVAILLALVLAGIGWVFRSLWHHPVIGVIVAVPVLLVVIAVAVAFISDRAERRRYPPERMPPP